MEDYVVTCPLVPDVPHLRSGGRARIPLLSGIRRPASLDCRRSRACRGGLPPDPASQRRPCPSPILRLRDTWYRDFHPDSHVPCLAHTLQISRNGKLSADFALLGQILNLSKVKSRVGTFFPHIFVA